MSLLHNTWAIVLEHSTNARNHFSSCSAFLSRMYFLYLYSNFLWFTFAPLQCYIIIMASKGITFLYSHFSWNFFVAYIYNFTPQDE